MFKQHKYLGEEKWFSYEEYRLLFQTTQFCSQHPHGRSQLSLTPVPEDLPAAF